MGGGAAGDPGECVSRGAAAGSGVGGGAEGVGGSAGCEAGDGGLGREQLGEEMREPGLPTLAHTGAALPHPCAAHCWTN